MMRTARQAQCMCIAAALGLAGQAVGDEDAFPDDVVDADSIIADEDGEELLDLSLEELMDIKVMSATRTRGQNLFDAPAAIYVITAEDIRRSGHSTIPELLRMAPGVHVARTDANTWIVATRGFGMRFNPEQLVQLDGRTLYNAGFSGVLWIAQDTVLEDIDRIEIIRGPGGSLWGSNAVNGIINIVTRSAEQTQGTFVELGGGVHDRALGVVRYGGKLSEHGWFRVYVKGHAHDDFDTLGPAYSDDWRRVQSGFRADFTPGDDHFTVQGDIYDVTAGEAVKNVDIAGGSVFDVDDEHEHHGANLLARWTRTFSDASDMRLQAYYDLTDWTVPFADGDFTQTVHTVDLDFQHTFEPVENHQLVWGLGYRHVNSEYDFAGVIDADDATIQRDTYTGFIQDTITLVDGRLTAHLGTKLEHNDLTGFELQPSGRLVWTPCDAHVLWGSVSRAVRVPSSVEDSGLILIDAPFPGVPARLIGDHGLKAENALTWELGYRTQPCENLGVDATVFYSDMDDRIGSTPVGLADAMYATTQKAEAYGFEAAATWEAAENWTLKGTYSLLRVDITNSFLTNAEDSPQQMFTVRSMLDLTDDLELNAHLYWVDDVAARDIDAYLRFDLGATWRINDSTTFSIWGLNLLDDQHPESSADGFLSRGSAEIERIVYATVSFEF
jgi:iron complex outermembrane receptor protein